MYKHTPFATFKTLIVTAFALLGGADSHAQENDKYNYAYPVLDVPGYYSANFGEFRSGRYHGGVDIKTDGVEGKPLVSMGDGYISRIVIAPGGYGRAMYITLDNGQVVVYGHMVRFRDDIEQSINKIRTSKKSNTIDQWYGAKTWTVKRGELVGYAGNSGSSFGPHLHLELRDTVDDRRLNIFKYGVIRPTDTVHPLMMKLHYVKIDTIRGVAQKRPLKSFALTTDSRGKYSLTAGDTIALERGGHFVIEASDRKNNVTNTFGIYRASMDVDSQRLFEYQIDGFKYSEFGLSNAISYYPIQRQSRTEAIRLAQVESAPRTLYPKMVNRGYVDIAQGQIVPVQIEVEDDCNNITTLKFWVEGKDASPAPEVDSTAIVIRHDRSSKLQHGDRVRVNLSSRALLEPIFWQPTTKENVTTTTKGVKILSPAYTLFSADVPLQKSVDISIQCEVAPELQSKVAIAALRANGSLSNLGDEYKDGYAATSTRTSGALVVVADVQAPTAAARFAEGADLSAQKTLTLTAKDNFSGIASYKLLIDGQWAICEYYPILGEFYHRLAAPTGTSHTYEFTATDGLGNSTTIKGTFFR